MQDDEFAQVGGHRRQFAVVAASAVSVVLVSAAVIGVHSWRHPAAHVPAAAGIVAATPSASAFASSVSSGPAVSASDPASSPAPIVSPAPLSSPPSRPSPSPSASLHHPSLQAPVVADESHLNFKVTMRLSSSHVMLGQQTRVTVTILNAGHGIDPPAEASIGSMVPGDDFSDAPQGCTTGNGGVECPVPVLRAGRAFTISFTITTGYYPGDTWDDQVYGQLNYADSYGQEQQIPSGYSAHLMVDAGTPSSGSPTSAAPSN